MNPAGETTRAALAVFGLALFLALEAWIPLRAATQKKPRRVIRNLAFAAAGALVVRFTFLPFAYATAQATAARGWGLLNQVSLPYGLEVAAGVLLMDFTFYYWHVINHRLPFLWRFHNVHHTDLDLDVTTAARFHAAELLLSVPFRALQIAVIGVDVSAWILFEVLVVASTQFHHANIRLPEGFERILNRVIVTPRMHGIHHSIVERETNSNFSTIFSFWDRLNRSFEYEIRQNDIVIGVAAYRDPNELGFLRLWTLPLDALRRWRLPDGSVPVRGRSGKMERE